MSVVRVKGISSRRVGLNVALGGDDVCVAGAVKLRAGIAHL